jgi:hypothetical protein
MPSCCTKPKITDLKRSARLTRKATREATRNAIKGGKSGSLVKPRIKKANVKKAKPCCGDKPHGRLL